MPSVCVTGATGYIAAVIVKLLVENNYDVRGTVRSLSSPHAKELESLYPIKLYEADLLGGPEAFAEAFDGVDFVMHTASPFRLKVEDPQTDLVDPALNGTNNVLTAALAAKVKRVVVTSSCAAVGPPQTQEEKDKLPADYAFSHKDWLSHDCTLENGPYRLSKFLAEKAAWEFAEKNNMELAVINPAFVVGPPAFSRLEGESLNLMKNLVSGEGVFTNKRAIGTVDVRDVALAHLKAIEVEEAAGKRFILSCPEAFTFYELASSVKPDLPKDGDVGYRAKYDASQTNEVLGITLSPIPEAVVDMAKAVEEILAKEKQKQEL